MGFLSVLFQAQKEKRQITRQAILPAFPVLFFVATTTAMQEILVLFL